TSMHSRNNRCGQLIGQGVKADEAIRQVGMVVEGINALPAAMELKEKYNVELPIIETVNDIINNGADPKRSVYDLMNREKKDEIEF
ncbi:MAG: glycerol-3-phosphate cytidylyltransferase, partial [Solobacterium sp.]|nr:glycerol-3-phosphate cytidylyltransferase [Solobacterium sp.]